MRLRVSGPALFLLLLNARPAPAEPLEFSGKVVDASGAPIAWALLRVEGTAIVAQSGPDGAFTLAGQASGIVWPDPVPPGRLMARAPRTLWLLADGRAASSRDVASTLLLARPAAGGKALRATGLPNAARASRSGGDDTRPPDPPLPRGESPRSSIAGWTVTVTMANFSPRGFPQAAATGTGLALTLARSPTDTAAWAAEKRLCLDTINALRAGLGLAKVAWSKSLEAFADQGARYDAERNKAHAHFGAWSTRSVPSDAENAIPGWPLKEYKSVAKVVRDGAKSMWDEGPGGGHYENIRGDHTQVGCGIYVTPSGAVWVIHDFK